MNEINFLPPWITVQTPRQHPPNPEHRQRILVADDELIIRRLNSEILASAGYEVKVAEDGAAAWEYLQLNSYDLLITDNRMPNLSGLELMRKIHAAHLALPVVMATGQFPADEFAREPWLQPVVTLLKPYTFDELLAAAKHAVAVPTESQPWQVQPLNWFSRPTASGQSATAA